MTSHEVSGRRMPLERKVLRDTVHDQIFRMLVDGTLAPGTSLSIDGLARDLCVSPTPVREALVHLEHTGVVRRAALRGYTVADPPTRRELVDLAEARQVVEGAALRSAFRSETWSADLGGALERALDAQRAAYDELAQSTFGTPAQLFAYLSAEWQFHRELVALGGNPYLSRMVDLLSAEVHRGRRGVDGRASEAPESLAEHRAIVEAVRSGDQAGAQEALRAHLDGVLARAGAGEQDDTAPAALAENA